MQQATTSLSAPHCGPRTLDLLLSNLVRASRLRRGRGRPPGGEPAPQEILTAPAGPGGSSGRILSRDSGLLLDSSRTRG